MSDKNKPYTRRDTLRLRGFDYASKRIYCVTVVVSERRRLFLDHRMARATIECLIELRHTMGFNLYCYCLMPDHFHALIGPGESHKSLGETLGAFKSLSTRRYWEWYDGRLWQRQFFDHIIRNEQDFDETITYILNNPVRRGLVANPGAWPYSGGLDLKLWDA